MSIKQQVSTSSLLDENIAQKETCAQKQSEAQARLQQIEALLQDPKSDAITLIQERSTLTQAIEVFGGQVEALNKRIESLEAKLRVEAQDSKKAQLRQALEREDEVLAPRIRKIEALVDDLKVELRELFDESNSFNALRSQLGMSAAIAFNPISLPAIEENAFSNSRLGVSLRSFDWVKPEIRAAAYQAQVVAERMAADAVKAAKQRQQEQEKQKEIQWLQREIKRLEGLQGNALLSSRERGSNDQNLTQHKANLARLLTVQQPS
jgi:hypothetical protein